MGIKPRSGTSWGVNSSLLVSGGQGVCSPAAPTTLLGGQNGGVPGSQQKTGEQTAVAGEPLSCRSVLQNVIVSENTDSLLFREKLKPRIHPGPGEIKLHLPKQLEILLASVYPEESGV